MKKIFITAVLIILAALTIPAARAFAEETFPESSELADIPIRGRSESGKAYCLYEEKDGVYRLTYVNSEGTKTLYKSDEKFEYNSSISEDGKTVFFCIDHSAVYRYSYESGKRKKIYTVPESKNRYKNYAYVYSSPNGEYCVISVENGKYFDDYKQDIEMVLWHGGETVSQTVRTQFGYEDSDRFYGVNDSGEVFYTLDGDIYILDPDGNRLAEKIPKKAERTELYRDSRTYMFYLGNDFYFGEVGGERHKLSFPDNSKYYPFAKNSESFIIYNGEYIARYNIKSGESKNILKISAKKYEERSDIYFIRASGDLNEVVYINSSKKKLVRLSDWNAEKNRYTNRQEIELNGTGQESIADVSPDLNTVQIMYGDAEYNRFKADFENNSFVRSNFYTSETDRFGHEIIWNGGKIEILNPDGSKTEVFDGLGASCEPWISNGFFCFYSGGPDSDCDYEGEYDLTYYYICPKGKAVKWYDLEDTYMECHYLYDEDYE